MFAELVDVDAAHMDTPISHHGMDRPERKKSFASRPARREQKQATPASTAKKAAIATQSQVLRRICVFIATDSTTNRHVGIDRKPKNMYNKTE